MFIWGEIDIMALCLRCGAVLHEDDLIKHKCKSENLAVKGKEKIPTTTEEVIINENP